MAADSRELVHLAAPPMSVVDMRSRSQHVQALIKDLMVADVHYMVIPGTQNRSLTKQGSEMLLSAFHIAVEPEIIETSDPDFVRYTVKITGRHMGSGIVVGVGVGRCSSNEEKYKWRAAVCKQEWDATAEDRRRLKWAKGKNDSVYSVNQVRTNPEDLANTVLKMAKKRAQADLCLTALAASDAFRPQPKPTNTDPTPEELRAQTRARPEPSQGPETKAPDRATKPANGETNGPSGATNSPRPATAAQLGLLKRKLDQSGIPDNHFMAEFQIGALEELPFVEVDRALKWISDLVDP